MKIAAHWRNRGLSHHQAYVLLAGLTAKASIVVVYESEARRAAAQYFCVRPTQVALSRRVYDERSIAAGVGRVIASKIEVTVRSLTSEQFNEIASALARDGARGIAQQVSQAIRDDDRPSAVDTVLKVASAITDGHALWQLTANLLTTLARV